MAAGGPKATPWRGGLLGLRSGAGLLLLLAACAAGCGDRPAGRAGPVPGVDVLDYDVTLTLDPPALALRGETTLTIARQPAVDVLPLELVGAEVDAVVVEGAPVTARYARGTLGVPLPAGDDTLRLTIRYRAAPEAGLYEAEYEGQRVVFTDAWPYRGRAWLPGVHHPADPATLTLTLDLPAGPDAVATGRLVAVDSTGGRVRRRWRLEAPAPTYTFAFALSDLTTSQLTVGDTLPVALHMLARDAAAAAQLRRTPEMIAFFSELLGPYPYETFASVQIPFEHAGMENASLAFLQARLFDVGGAEETMVHEVAHQWFGNHVVLATWRDLWLSEGFATYLTTLFYEHADGEDAARMRRTAISALTGHRQRTHRALVPAEESDPERMLTWVPYQKGASVLHLLRLVVGDAAFERALRTVVAEFGGRPLSTEALHSVFERVSGREFAPLFDYWVYGDRLPTLSVAWDAAARTLSWEVRDDAGTLGGVPFELAIRHGGGAVRYVPAGEGRVTLDGGSAEKPDVRPVGILMHVK